MAESTRPRPDDIAYLTQLVRASDRPRYYATLFAPADSRADLFAIYGFAAEIARVPDQVSEPTLGEIRLKWWLDALERVDGRAGEGETPAIRALSATVARHNLSRAPFAALIGARSVDLYSDPPRTLSDVEGRLGETESVLFQMAAIVAGAAGRDSADAAGHAGVGYGLARRLAAFAPERARGRTILPAALLAEDGLSGADVFAASPPPALQKTVSALARSARRHLGLARAHVASLPKGVRSAFLPLAVVRPLLERLERLGPSIVRKPTSLSDLEMLTRIAIARLRGLGAGRDDAVAPP